MKRFCTASSGGRCGPTARTRKLFRLPSAGAALATFRYTFWGDGGFSQGGYGINVVSGLVSIRRSTKRIQPQDGRTGFGAPHAKPSVRPSIFLKNLRIPLSGRK